MKIITFLLISWLSIFSATSAWAEPGVTDTTIRIGSVMDLQSDAKARDLAVKAGIEAAFKGEKIQGRTIEFIALNHSFDKKIAADAAKQLIDQGIFVMLGSVGSPMTKAIVPILAENKVPAIAFVTGEEHLRPGIGDIINFRASTAQEFNATIEAALAAGVKPQQICAYIPNDATSIVNLASIKTILAQHPGMTEITQKLEQIIAMQPDESGKEPNRNGLGPVGFYSRQMSQAREGYQSLKQWEQTTGAQCRLVLAQGPNFPIANFIAYARYKGEDWVAGVFSTSDAKALEDFLKSNNVTDKVIMTQVVPFLDSPLPIVEEARNSLGEQLSYISLEGFIAGKMFVTIANDIKGDLTRENFLKSVRGRTFNLGGLRLDFSTDNQGSDAVNLTYLDGGRFQPISSQQLARVFQQ